jgi:hypothetical protein
MAAHEAVHRLAAGLEQMEEGLLSPGSGARICRPGRSDVEQLELASADQRLEILGAHPPEQGRPAPQGRHPVEQHALPCGGPAEPSSVGRLDQGPDHCRIEHPLVAAQHERLVHGRVQGVEQRVVLAELHPRHLYPDASIRLDLLEQWAIR